MCASIYSHVKRMLHYSDNRGDLDYLFDILIYFSMFAKTENFSASCHASFTDPRTGVKGFSGLQSFHFVIILLRNHF